MGLLRRCYGESQGTQGCSGGCTGFAHGKFRRSLGCSEVTQGLFKEYLGYSGSCSGDAQGFSEDAQRYHRACSGDAQGLLRGRSGDDQEMLWCWSGGWLEAVQAIGCQRDVQEMVRGLLRRCFGVGQRMFRQ